MPHDITTIRLMTEVAEEAARALGLAPVGEGRWVDTKTGYGYRSLDSALTDALVKLAEEDRYMAADAFRLLPIADRDRIAAALGFYIDRCNWIRPEDQAELEEYRRLLAMLDS